MVVATAKSCSVARFEELAAELRQLQSGLEHTQARLASVLAQVEAALSDAAEGAQAPGEFHEIERDAGSLTAALAFANRDAALEPAEAVDATAEIEAEAPAAEETEAEIETEVSAEIEAPAEVEIAAEDAGHDASGEITENFEAEAEAAVEPARAELTEEIEAAAVPPAPVAEEPPVIEAVTPEPVEVRREPAKAEAETAPRSNVIVLYEHPRIRPRRGPSPIAVAGRWAASIVVVATIAAIAAAGGTLARRDSGIITGSNPSIAGFMTPTQAPAVVDEPWRQRAAMVH